MTRMSLAAEGVVEIVKGIFPPVAATASDTNKERRRHMTLQLLAALAGIAVAVTTRTQLNNVLGNLLQPDSDIWTFSNMGSMAMKYSIIGVMVSGGSPIWNHALGIVGALKTAQEKNVA